MTFTSSQPALQPGDFAPDFSLEAHIGQSPLRLADLRGHIALLAFYVLDFTGT